MALYQPPLSSIFWDGYGLASAESGIGFHARALATGLQSLGVVPTLVAEREAAQDLGLPALALPATRGLGRLLLGSKPAWPLRVRKALLACVASGAIKTPVVLHGLSNVNLPILSLPKGVRTVLTVHDLIGLLEPEGVSLAYRTQLKLLLPRVLATADRVICVSDWTKSTLVERFPRFAAKLVVIKNGRPLWQGAAATNAGAPPRLLYVARHETYKRLRLFLDILRVGRPEWQATLVTNAAGVEWSKQYASELVQSGRLRLCTGLSTEQYKAVFADADVYVHTSRLEGFCLPAVDALARAVPVVYEGSGGALQEVVGTAAAVQLPQGAAISDWLSGIELALRRRAEPSFLGAAESTFNALPSWKDAASQVQKVYNSLMTSDS